MTNRKFKLSIITLAILAAGFVATAWLTALEATFAAFVGGVVAVCGLYFGGNVAQKATAKKEDAQP